MFTRGYAKHHCTRVVCSRGLAVGRVERYRRRCIVTLLQTAQNFLHFLLR